MGVEGATEAAGSVLEDRYRLDQLIGTGSAGAVWEGFDIELGRRVALKILHRELAQHGEIRQRFIAEAQASQRIAHRNVVEVLGEGETADGVPFQVMELCDGETLDIIVQLRGALGPPFACELLSQVLDALEAAHALGIVHRDLKPANIMVVHPHPNQAVAKVLDFGIAKGVHPDGSDPDESGRILGTPGYMAPEQAAGDEVDGRADIYASAAILYELLTGRAPFVGKMPSLVLADVLTRPPKPLRYYDRSIPSALERVVLRALSKDVQDRPQSALELKRQLRPWMPVESARPAVPSQFDRGSEPPLPLVAPQGERSTENDAPVARLELTHDTVPPPSVADFAATDRPPVDDRPTHLDALDDAHLTDPAPPPSAPLSSPPSRRLLLLADSEPPPPSSDGNDDG